MSSAPLAAREAYRLWAPTYDEENVVTTLERAAVQRLTPSLAGVRLLDVGCGTGRRLPRGERDGRDERDGRGKRHGRDERDGRVDADERGEPDGRVDADERGEPDERGGRGRRRRQNVPAFSLGVDLVPEMLRQAAARGGPAALAAADVCALPCRSAAFDVVWCRLVLGHLPDLAVAYSELARVARPGACVVVTDFHSAAVRAGHQRTFRDAAGELHVIEHHVHDSAAHSAAASRAGLTAAALVEPAVGPAVRRFYAAADRLDAYRAQRSLPLVVALLYRA